MHNDERGAPSCHFLPATGKPHAESVSGAGIRQEIGRIGRIAGPLVVGQLSQVGMGFTDTVMAGRLGTIDLGAVAIGSTLWLPVYLACVGVTMAMSPSVAHHEGAGKRRAVGVLYRQSLWLSGVLALTLTAVAMLVYVATPPRYRAYRLFARPERRRSSGFGPMA